MTRRVEEVVIDQEGRDKGKTFQITEMASEQGENWAFRLLFAMGRSGVDVPDEMMSQGWAGVAYYGVKAMFQLRWEDAKPLLDEMWQCIEFIPSARARPRKLMEEDVEEVATRIFLRLKVFELHSGFSITGGGLNSLGMQAPAPGFEVPGNTSTSRVQ